MRIAIIGFPGAGKTTIFNALTGAERPGGTSRATSRLLAGSGTVPVPDSRLQALSALYRPKKTTDINLTFGDVGGIDERGGVSGELGNELAQWDGLMLILRAFENPSAANPTDPQHELDLIEAELILQDQLNVERRLERLAEDRQKGARDRGELERKAGLFEKLAESLHKEQPLRTLDLSEPELQGFGLLTLKPLLTVVNLEENGGEQRLEGGLQVYGKLEEELSQLSAEEAASFRAEFGVAESGAFQLLQASLELLDQVSFFTVSEREVKAWSLQRGSTALEAAGTIHTDMARGFIRAEVIDWEELVEYGGLNQARQGGRLRVVGKEYPLEDGEVMHVRFNV
jgi:ribosome-binding ATPase YchF (GTP1/OBG family)